MRRNEIRVALLVVMAAVALSAFGCGSREADAPRPVHAQAANPPAPAPAPEASPAPPAVAPAQATPPAAEAAAPEAKPAEQESEMPKVALPVLPPADQRSAVRDVKMRDVEGREVTLAGLRGKPAMIVFWATWCRPCSMEIPHLVHLQETYAKRGLRIVAVSLDANGLAAVKPFLEKHPEMTYTVVPNGMEAQAAFGGIRSIPNSFVLDRQGRIVKQFVGLTPGEDLEGWVQAVLREKS
jgi:thiol-disulfide isomerase/thioredoxin